MFAPYLARLGLSSIVTAILLPSPSPMKFPSRYSSYLCIYVNNDKDSTPLRPIQTFDTCNTTLSIYLYKYNLSMRSSPLLQASLLPQDDIFWYYKDFIYDTLLYLSIYWPATNEELCFATHTALYIVFCKGCLITLFHSFLSLIINLFTDYYRMPSRLACIGKIQRRLAYAARMIFMIPTIAPAYIWAYRLSYFQM
jgi:hypothetical protein